MLLFQESQAQHRANFPTGRSLHLSRAHSVIGTVYRANDAAQYPQVARDALFREKNQVSNLDVALISRPLVTHCEVWQLRLQCRQK